MRFLQFDTDGISHYFHTFIVLLFALILAFTRSQDGLNSLRAITVIAASILEEPVSNVRVYRNALKTNAYLQQQNILLQDELSKLRSIEKENQELKSLLRLEESYNYPLQITRVVTKQLNTLNNSLSVNVGSNKGIQRGMPLINSDGLIGKVILAASNYSQVMPLSHPLFRVSAQIQDSKANGIITWDISSPSYLIMDFVPKTVTIDTGMVIQTSGLGNEFPAGIPIGQVVDFRSQEGTNTQQLKIEPFSKLNEVSEGFIVLFTSDTSLVQLNNEFNQLFE
ncbi:rod shape-determining protein MreC [Bacteroidota bacterium]|jgi:rod shape-determining protein MreC|nr:rod shape-determining protein MreC [Bacteroidota bacterium]MDC3297173.1 rod shape-determining protein MreC [Balneolaceae bacterium]PDH55027.1 MAG: rod shape-determining protein MreC [Rhodothermaeota bacterium MED-G12]CAI8385703.1 MAG: Cell shape-determining protein MreC [Rhodothermaeota bacterium MED-G12]|tara:strand:- start:124 stop:966 length:843 start_codon:yes stop_codon:yes gene_type:complete